MNKSGLLRAGLVACIMALAGPVGAAGDCAPDRLDIRNGSSSVRFTVEVADDAREREVGLMNRPEMGRFNGMVFVYDTPHPVRFWMRNTLIPLDMLFVDSRGIVETLHENARPMDETPVYGGPDIQYVVEINGGMARQLGIGVGSQIRHPAVNGPDVVWPCE